MPQLSCQELTLGYDGRTVVSGLTFAVYAGDYLCIVGENGSGKSTLMKAILKLIPPMSGQIIEGEGFFPGEIGYLPQQTAIQKDFPASVQEIVRTGCLNRRGMRPYYNKQEKLLAEEAMADLGISDLSKRCFRELSGGQQQRTLLARALCAARRILLLDEPVAGLDPLAASEMYALIQDLNKKGITILMISHDVEASMQYASRILHLSNPIYNTNKSPDYFFGAAAAYPQSRVGRAFIESKGANA